MEEAESNINTGMKHAHTAVEALEKVGGSWF